MQPPETQKPCGGSSQGALALFRPGCLQVTPVWRAGPHGPKTLCNACGVRWMKVVKGGPPPAKKQ